MRLARWKKIAFVFALAALAVVACSRVYNWPVRFRPKWAWTPGSLAAGRPSGTRPDNIVLVPAGDMSSSVSVTWRTSDSVADGVVRYRVIDDRGGGETVEARAARTVLSAPELREDADVHCFSAVLDRLAPGTTYAYRVGSGDRDLWSEEAAFTTAEETPASFSFVYMGDTQIDPDSVGDMLAGIEERHPEAAFYMISGDIVDYGDWRNLWDEFLAGTNGVFSRKLFAPALGNHDPGDQNLGSGIFNASFNTPNRNPEAPGRVENYSFRRGAAQFIVINQPGAAAQAAWLERELQAAGAGGAEFKIVMFHEPVYNPDETRSNAPAQAEWVPLFDRYGVDLVLTGHDHSYARSQPLKAGKPVPPGEFGTTYVVSTACGKFSGYKTLDAHAIQFTDVATYQLVTLAVGGDGGADVRYRAYSADGEIVDEFSYAKR